MKRQLTIPLIILLCVFAYIFGGYFLQGTNARMERQFQESPKPDNDTSDTPLGFYGMGKLGVGDSLRVYAPKNVRNIPKDALIKAWWDRESHAVGRLSWVNTGKRYVTFSSDAFEPECPQFVYYIAIPADEWMKKP